jgi:hypothetical protein
MYWDWLFLAEICSQAERIRQLKLRYIKRLNSHSRTVCFYRTKGEQNWISSFFIFNFNIFLDRLVMKDMITSEVRLVAISTFLIAFPSKSS